MNTHDSRRSIVWMIVGFGLHGMTHLGWIGTLAAFCSFIGSVMLLTKSDAQRKINTQRVSAEIEEGQRIRSEDLVFTGFNAKSRHYDN